MPTMRLLILIGTLVLAAAKFEPLHPVNDVDINGKVCHLQTQTKTCPSFAVKKNGDSSPQALCSEVSEKLACPTNTTLLLDGKCHSEAHAGNLTYTAGLTNPLQSETYYQCLSTEVEIVRWYMDGSNAKEAAYGTQDLMTMRMCLEDYGILEPDSSLGEYHYGIAWKIWGPSIADHVVTGVHIPAAGFWQPERLVSSVASGKYCKNHVNVMGSPGIATKEDCASQVRIECEWSAKFNWRAADGLCQCATDYCIELAPNDDGLGIYSAVDAYTRWEETPGWGYSWTYYCFAAWAVITVLFWMYKRMSEEPESADSQPTDVVPDDDSEEMTTDKGHDADKHIVQIGYTRDIFGSLCFFLLIACSIISQLFLLAIVLDIYGRMCPFVPDGEGAYSLSKCDADVSISNGIGLGKPGQSYLLFGWIWVGGTSTSWPFERNTYPGGVVSEMVFIIVWTLAAAWFVMLKLLQPKIAAFYARRCTLVQASVVVMRKKKDKEILLKSQDRVMQFAEWADKNFGSEFTETRVPVQTSPEGTKFIEFQCLRYAWNPDLKRFTRVSVVIGPTLANLHADAGGLGSTQATRRFEYIGPNTIPAKVPPIMTSISNEFFSIFYIYRMFCQWVWYYFVYWYAAILQTVVIVVAGGIKIYVQRRGQKSVAEMVGKTYVVHILRDGVWTKKTNVDIVPGDIVKVEPDTTVPADLCLLSGTCVCDESMLTGEAMPVQKVSAKNNDKMYSNTGSGAKMTLFAGTGILSVRGDNVVGIAMKTGAHTQKGEMIQSILFPSPLTYVFDEHLKVVCGILFAWGVVVFFVCLFLIKGSMAAWFYGVFTISQILSPLLPSVLVGQQSMSADRLRRLNIFAVDLRRINMCGKVKVFCFDKTGTLTKEGLDYHSVQPIADKAFGTSFDKDTQVPGFAGFAVGACHEVAMSGSTLVGNPVDIMMYKASGWKLSEEGAITIVTRGDEKLEIVKRFEFDRTVMSMSCVVKETKTGKHFALAKGSFERCAAICSPSKLPDNFTQRTEELAREGFYVLGLCGKEIKVEDEAALVALSREDLESDLEPLGLINFRNELKPDTKKALEEIREGDIRPIMITGDNALTGMHIAKESGLAVAGKSTILGDIDGRASQVGDLQVVWKIPETGEVIDLANIELSAYHLAVTGNAFRILMKTDAKSNLLPLVKIFARMTPDDKVQAVQLHMEYAVTAMCGDGGNDCGALRAAHVGLALSDAEASIVSPFSTSDKSINSCVNLMKYGRGSLATSFASYKFLIMYGEILCFLSIVQYYLGILPPLWFWITIDVILTPGLAFGITMALPEDKLTPSRPTVKLLGFETVSSVCSQVFINTVFLAAGVAMLFNQEWFLCHEFSATGFDGQWWLKGDNFESVTIGFIIYFQFFGAAAVSNWGFLYRRAYWRNYVFVVMWLFGMIFFTVIMFAPTNSAGCYFRVNCGDETYLERHGIAVPNSWVGPGCPCADQVGAPLGYDPANATTWNGFMCDQPLATTANCPDDPLGNNYNSKNHHNILPAEFRVSLWLLCMFNILIGVLWEKYVILGPVRTWFKNRYNANLKDAITHSAASPDVELKVMPANDVKASLLKDGADDKTKDEEKAGDGKTEDKTEDEEKAGDAKTEDDEKAGENA